MMRNGRFLVCSESYQSFSRVMGLARQRSVIQEFSEIRGSIGNRRNVRRSSKDLRICSVELW